MSLPLFFLKMSFTENYFFHTFFSHFFPHNFCGTITFLVKLSINWTKNRKKNCLNIFFLSKYCSHKTFFSSNLFLIFFTKFFLNLFFYTFLKKISIIFFLKTFFLKMSFTDNFFLIFFLTIFFLTFFSLIVFLTILFQFLSTNKTPQKVKQW